MKGLIILVLTMLSMTVNGQFLITSTATSSSGIAYYISADGDDNDDGLTPATAWKTISQVNGETFDPDDQILFNKGDEWREQLTIPSSGEAGSPITFASYGTGDRPIINGSDSVNTWTEYIVGAGMNSKNIWEQAVASSSSQTQWYNMRQIIPANEILYAGTHIRIHVNAHATADTYIEGSSIGLRDGSTDDFSGSPVRITWGGENDTLIAAGDDAFSDWIEFSPDDTNDLLVHFYGTPLRYTYGSGGNAYRSNTTDDNTLTSSVSYTSSSYIFLIDTLQVGVNDHSTWASVITENPKIAIFNDTLGVEVLTKSSVVFEKEWFWDDDTLFTSSSTNPGDRYDLVEAGARTYCITDGILGGDDDSYINIEGIQVQGSIKDGMLFYGSGSNINITDCYAHNTRQLGFALWGYSNSTVSYSLAEYAAAGFYCYPGCSYVTFSSDTSRYSKKYINGVNTNGQSNDGHGFGLQESDSCIIEYCVAKDNGDGAIIVDNNNINNLDAILRYNKALGSTGQLGTTNNNYGFGIARIGAGSDILMHHNISYNYGRNLNSNLFVQVTEAANINIYNNTFVNPSTVDGDVLRWYETSTASVDFRNNIVVGYRTSTGYQLHDASTDDFTYSDYNLFYGPGLTNPFEMVSTQYNDLAAWQTGTSLDANSVEDNPDFTSEFTDFSLQVGSPAINAGVDVGLTEDIDGNPLVGDPDIGAYEKQ